MSCCANNGGSSQKSSSCCASDTHATIRRHYARYIEASTTPIQGNLLGLDGMGYKDTAFLDFCGYGAGSVKKEEDIVKFLEPFCGSGCPLRLLMDTPDRTVEGVDGVKADDVIVDLGCGAGHDVILASGLLNRLATTNSNTVKQGRVIGVDLTEEMLAVAEQNIQKFGPSGNKVQIQLVCDAFDTSPDELALGGYLKANMADICISNGVFNLCDDKRAAFRTAFWLLKPGGTFILSDVCQVQESPDETSFFSPFPGDKTGGGDAWSA